MSRVPVELPRATYNPFDLCCHSQNTTIDKNLAKTEEAKIRCVRITPNLNLVSIAVRIHEALASIRIVIDTATFRVNEFNFSQVISLSASQQDNV